LYRIERREKGTSPLVTKDEQQKKELGTSMERREETSPSEPEISWENEVYCRDREMNEFIRDYKRRQRESEPCTINHSSVCFADRKLDPHLIQRYISCEYKKSKLATVVIRRDDATISICKGHRIKIFGVKTWCKIVYSLQCIRHLFSMILPDGACRFGDIINMNIVAQTCIDPKFTRDSISNMNKKYPHDTSYRPILHPSCNYYHQHEPVFTASIYDSGFISIAGLKTKEQKREALNIVYQRIARSIDDGPLRTEFVKRYIELDTGGYTTTTTTTTTPQESETTKDQGWKEGKVVEQEPNTYQRLTPSVASMRESLADEHKTEFIKLQNIYKKKKLFNTSKLKIHKQRFISRLDRHRCNEREGSNNSILSRIKNSYYTNRRNCRWQRIGSVLSAVSSSSSSTSTLSLPPPLSMTSSSIAPPLVVLQYDEPAAAAAAQIQWSIHSEDDVAPMMEATPDSAASHAASKSIAASLVEIPYEELASSLNEIPYEELAPSPRHMIHESNTQSFYRLDTLYDPSPPPLPPPPEPLLNRDNRPYGASITEEEEEIGMDLVGYLLL